MISLIPSEPLIIPSGPPQSSIMAPTTIRLGTASPGTQANTAETLAQLEHLARRAAAKKIDILLLPEAYIGGYPRGTSFGALIGSRTDEGRNEYLQYFRCAVDLGDTVGDGAGAGEAWVNRTLPGDAVPGSSSNDSGIINKRGDGTREELERIARDTGVLLVTGLIEKTGGSLYCSVVYVCPKLGMLGKRRKVMPTGSERLVWAQGSPSTLRAVSTIIRGVRINLGAAICWENYMPLLRQSLYAQNINLYLAPTADNRSAWLSLMRTVAVEGRCFVVTSNMCVRKPGSASSPPAFLPAHSLPEPEISPSTISDSSSETSDHPPFASQARRSSCVTEEGFEIALPGHKSHVAATQPKSQEQLRQQPQEQSQQRLPTARRTSVFDEDGNEIVLCCKKSAAATSSSQPDATPIAAPPAFPPVFEDRPAPPVNKPKPRRAITPATTTASVTDATKEEGFISLGGSAILNPFGDVVSGPQWKDDTGLIYADVDFDDCIRGRLDLDTAGSYSRNDSFKFSVEGLDLSPLPY